MLSFLLTKLPNVSTINSSWHCCSSNYLKLYYTKPRILSPEGLFADEPVSLGSPVRFRLAKSIFTCEKCGQVLWFLQFLALGDFILVMHGDDMIFRVKMIASFTYFFTYFALCDMNNHQYSHILPKMGFHQQDNPIWAARSVFSHGGVWLSLKKVETSFSDKENKIVYRSWDKKKRGPTWFVCRCNLPCPAIASELHAIRFLVLHQ